MIYATYGILNPTVEWENIPYANQEAYEAVSYTHSPSPRDKRQSRMPSSA